MSAELPTANGPFIAVFPRAVVFYRGAMVV